MRADISDPRYFVWTNLNVALKAGNKVAALTFLTPTAQEVYATALSEVVKQIALFAASSVPGLSAISVNESTADYLVASDVAGTRILTGIRFMLMDDGKWKIDSM